MNWKRTTLATLTAASLGMLAGCGGADSPSVDLDENQPAPLPEPETDPRLFSNGTLDTEPTLGSEIKTGVYRYTRTSPSGESTIGVALISSSGRISFALEDRSSFARIALQDNERFAERLLDTESAVLNQTRAIIGGRDRTAETQESGDRVSGTVVDQTTDSLIETFSLEKQVADELALSVSTLAGTYSGKGEAGISTTMSFEADGAVVGTDTTGCEFEGKAIIPNAAEDVVELQFSAQNCGPGTQVSGAARDGDYFALGRVDLSAQSVQIFTANGQVAGRMTLQDITTPPPPEAPPEFVNDDFDEEASVVAKLEPGIYDYTDIPLEESDGAVIESGFLLISPTGRTALLTDRRGLVSRIQVSELDSFNSEVRQEQRVDSEETASDAATIFGTPNNPSDEPFRLIGSLLNDAGELVNRYTAERNTADDAALAATPLTIDQLAGTYSQTRDPGAITTTITIDSAGAVTGSDTTGCAFVGNAVIPSGAITLIEMRVAASNCTATPVETGEERNGDYNILGSVDFTAPGTLNLILASDTNIDALSLERQ